MGITVDGPGRRWQRRRTPRRVAVFLADPARVGGQEADSLVAYYRREWIAFLVKAFGFAHAAFGMTRARTMVASWWVLRANVLWAPPAGNDPVGAQRNMARFYRLVAASHAGSFDPDRAAALELAWWREHRDASRRAGDKPDPQATQALAALYAHVFRLTEITAHPAAALRVRAFDASDTWAHTADLDPASQLVVEERALLVQSYAALADALRRQCDTTSDSN